MVHVHYTKNMKVKSVAKGQQEINNKEYESDEENNPQNQIWEPENYICTKNFKRLKDIRQITLLVFI